MPKTKRKRRPGAGRPPIDRQGSVIAQVRFTQDDWKRIEALASKHTTNGKGNASKEVRTAVRYWLRLLHKPEMHIGALTCFIAILVRRIEARTGKTWLSDPVTGAAVREEIGVLINSLAPEAKKGLVISPELRNIARDLIVIIAHLYQDPRLSFALSGDDDWAALAVIAKDLGPALLRNANKAIVTITEVKGRQK
jgi:hypothetical protein